MGKTPFHQGQTMMIRPDLIENEHYRSADGRHQLFIPKMMEYRGKTTTIRELDINGYAHRLEIDKHVPRNWARPGWSWSDEMLIPVDMSEEDLMHKYIHGQISDAQYAQLIKHARKEEKP